MLDGEFEVKKMMMETVAALRSLAFPVGELNVRWLKDGSHQRLRGQLPLSLLSPPAPSISPRFPSSPTTGPAHDLSVSHKDPASNKPYFHPSSQIYEPLAVCIVHVNILPEGP